MSMLASLLVVSWAIPASTAGQQESAGEYELKAAMLRNLADFVEWPAAAQNRQGPTVLCILGRDPFGGALTALPPAGRPVRSRSVSVRYLQNEADTQGCHILYISSSERKTAAEICLALKASTVLTVGEMAQFAEQGGMIQFSLEDQRVRFRINLNAASSVGLRISSRLLALATIVRG